MADDRPATKGDIDELKKDIGDSIVALSVRVQGISSSLSKEHTLNATQQMEINHLKDDVKGLKARLWGALTAIIAVIGKWVFDTFANGSGA